MLCFLTLCVSGTIGARAMKHGTSIHMVVMVECTHQLGHDIYFYTSLTQPIFYAPLTKQIYFEFSGLAPFLRNYKGLSYETWYMFTSGRVRLDTDAAHLLQVLLFFLRNDKLFILTSIL